MIDWIMAQVAQTGQLSRFRGIQQLTHVSAYVTGREVGASPYGDLTRCSHYVSRDTIDRRSIWTYLRTHVLVVR